MDDQNHLVRMEVIATATVSQTGSMISGETLDGRAFRVPASTFYEMRAKWLQHVSPAQVGYFVLEPCTSDDNRFAGWSRTKIVAWGVNYEGETVPITAQTISLEHEAILAPDGGVTDAFGSQFKSVSLYTLAKYPEFTDDDIFVD